MFYQINKPVMTILDKIVAVKREEVAVRKKYFPRELLRDGLFYERKPLSLVEALTKPGSTGIIAEFKRKSPSKGLINGTADIASVTANYCTYGAAGLSVLTDEQFFGGTWGDLLTARKNHIPILRKDFIIDEYQVTESKLLGADVILLIAACLSIAEVKSLAAQAKQEGMEVLLEVHTEEELAYICDEVDIVGVNSRNLKTFEVDRVEALRIAKLIPGSRPKLAESGIEDPASVHSLRQEGFNGFLIGETFMKNEDPGKAFKLFVDTLNKQR
jgi:indole-3-glycerol phosphate synthase